MSHRYDCPGGCKGRGSFEVPIPIEERPTVCYDHWDKYDYIPCDGGIKKAKGNMKLASVVAMTPGTHIIGKNNEIPWRIPSDLKRFKQLTLNSPVIMGRKTYESIIAFLKKPLPDRVNIVLTTNKKYKAPGCIVVNDLRSAFEACGNVEKAFVIGGAKIYDLTMPYIDELLVSFVLGAYDGDTAFPKFEKEWKLVSSELAEKGPKDDILHSFCVFRRKKSL